MKNVLAIFILLLSLSAISADSKAGKKLYKKINCAQCHGKDGMGKAKFKNGKWKLGAVKGPRIAGLKKKYTIEQLIAIQGKDKATRRKTKYTTSMKAKIKKLTEQDFKNLAKYIAEDLNPSAGKFKGLLQ